MAWLILAACAGPPPLAPIDTGAWLPPGIAAGEAVATVPEAWLDRPEAQWALISYVAIGPLIAGVVWPQRGFTRLSGLIHLPWLAYTLWLGLRLWTETPGGLYGIWLHVVFWSTALCLAFDIVDVVRWLRGTRYRLGTPAAVAAGASKPAAWQD